jgi:hypothetical protein
VGVWLLQLKPPRVPVLGGMPRQGVEERVHARYRDGLPIDDFELLDQLTVEAEAADLHALATLPAIDTYAQVSSRG